MSEKLESEDVIIIDDIISSIDSVLLDKEMIKINKNQINFITIQKSVNAENEYLVLVYFNRYILKLWFDKETRLPKAGRLEILH
jgi:hypothetical protein